MNTKIQLAIADDYKWIISALRKEAIKNAAVIQDLMRWPDNSQFHFMGNNDNLSFLHASGHPAHHDCPVFICDGSAEEVAALFKHVKPSAPFVVRETSDHLASVVHDYFPEGKIYREQRMDVTKATYKPAHRGMARQLSEQDAVALAQFFGAPPQAAGKFMGWLKGARAFQGVFEGGKLMAIGSSMVSIPEAWNLVSIQTHKDHRGKGLATEVTSSLIAKAFENTEAVTVTVVCDNAQAIGLYEKLGFRPTQKRVWIDCGADASP